MIFEGKTVGQLAEMEPFVCPSCGKIHGTKLKKVFIGKGVTCRTPEAVKTLGGTKVFVLDDENTKKAAGDAVLRALTEAGIPFTEYTMSGERTEPDENAVGSVMLHFNPSCDTVVGVGSGVVNDIGKIISGYSGRPYVIVGTAPSMDGYASHTSSIIRDGLKVSVNSKCPDIVIGDTEVLSKAPDRMKASGIGDMLAKYISVCEWRISRIINGEYYCDVSAELILSALEKCIDALSFGLGSEEAAGAVMEGLVLSGISVNYAGVTRPVSGMEHYFSHVWDMRNIEFGTPFDFHGIQCGIGTYQTVRVYEEIGRLRPDREKALKYVSEFDRDKWSDFLRERLGRGAEAMIENERSERKYDASKHAERLGRIIEKWDDIIKITGMLPPSERIKEILESIGAPYTAEQIGLTRYDEKTAFLMTKDIRDKYIGSRLLWDIGELDGVAEKLFGDDNA